jgi:addiction module HigA family antidote
MIERIRRILSILDVANCVEDMDEPTFRLHPLKGDLKGDWAVTVRANCRLVSHFRNVNAEVARGIGVTRQQLYRLINGQHGVSPDMALRLEQAFGGSADAWMRMQIAYDLAQARARSPVAIPRVTRKSA